MITVRTGMLWKVEDWDYTIYRNNKFKEMLFKLFCFVWFCNYFPDNRPKSKSLSHTFGTYWQKTTSQSPLDLENVETVLPNQLYKRWKGSDDIELPKQYKLHTQMYHKRHWKTEIFIANMDSATLHQCYLCYPCHPYPCWDFFFL